MLVVDDDPDILELLAYNLRKDGFRVRTQRDSADVLSAVHNFRPDLIILDIMMEGKSGIELCRELRSEPHCRDTYIFFLTANSQREVHELALETGGDDLIEKITGLRELSNKIRAVLVDNWQIRKRKNEIQVGDLRINRRTGEVFVGESRISLSQPELDLLYFFAQKPQKTN